MVYKYRDAYVVVDKIITIIPTTEIKLLNELEVYRLNLAFKAPELRTSSECWTPLQHILQNNVNTFEEKWKQDIRRIFNNE